jgi:DNA-binding response OmpR family regulator
MLPDTDGLTVCRRLKAERRTALIPIVVVTARLAHENRCESLGSGAADYVPKPYTPDQIFEAIDTARSWREQIDDQPAAGVIPLASTADSEPFAQIGRLQAMLLARTTWNEQEVWQLGSDLQRLATSLLAWGERHRASAVGSIGFDLNPKAFTLDVQDCAGWSADSSSSEFQTLESLAVPGRFDSVERAKGSAVIRLAKAFQ